ncbi:hypothetical protein CYLTODRAFT_407191 [Cylindrobasidium torrendii FP15055 ss-10]|uniref:C2H2-type domain-containing protein n=1 Tax=Cylindrobasidium torrendii FP15055 ss-10 TaxID=1314674 RepID=A0A0D7BQZ5_9AGAR|nr:hypothetical protein CYLTODRAFT_407191 [Cylindrobasidium torrendii FP15055 ss-10]
MSSSDWPSSGSIYQGAYSQTRIAEPYDPEWLAQTQQQLIPKDYSNAASTNDHGAVSNSTRDHYYPTFGFPPPEYGMAYSNTTQMSNYQEFMTVSSQGTQGYPHHDRPTVAMNTGPSSVQNASSDVGTQQWYQIEQTSPSGGGLVAQGGPPGGVSSSRRDRGPDERSISALRKGDARFYCNVPDCKNHLTGTGFTSPSSFNSENFFSLRGGLGCLEARANNGCEGHVRDKHINHGVHACQFKGCTKTYKDSTSLDRHCKKEGHY